MKRKETLASKAVTVFGKCNPSTEGKLMLGALALMGGMLATANFGDWHFSGQALKNMDFIPAFAPGECLYESPDTRLAVTYRQFQITRAVTEPLRSIKDGDLTHEVVLQTMPLLIAADCKTAALAGGPVYRTFNAAAEAMAPYMIRSSAMADGVFDRYNRAWNMQEPSIVIETVPVKPSPHP